MAPPGPSEDWKEYDRSTAPPKIARVIEDGDWKYLCAEAVSNHPSQTSNLRCTAKLTHFANGRINVVIELSFSDGTYWVARVIKPFKESGKEKKNEWVETMMVSGIATMRLVTQRTSLPVPVVYAYDANLHNTFGFRYVLMSALPGKTMKAPLFLTIPDASRTKVAKQMAVYVHQLSQITFPQIGQIYMGPDISEPPKIIAHHPDYRGSKEQLGPFTSSRAFFASVQQKEVDRIEALHGEDTDRPDWLTYCKTLGSTVPFLSRPELRRGPFPLHHQSLHFNNILFDDDFNITGIVDWDSQGTVPWERVGMLSDIMPEEHFPIDYNAKILLFRDAFIDGYKQVESPIPGGKGVLLSSILESPLPHVINAFVNASPPRSIFALHIAERLLHLLFGPETTFDNYKERQNRQRGKELPKVIVWGRVVDEERIKWRVRRT